MSGYPRKPSDPPGEPAGEEESLGDPKAGTRRPSSKSCFSFPGLGFLGLGV